MTHLYGQPRGRFAFAMLELQTSPGPNDSTFMGTLTADHYAAVIAQRMDAERVAISARWLKRLRGRLTVPVNDVFPSDQLLDHIPVLVEEIARYLAAPAQEAIAANAVVMAKARELGLLRHRQRATAHQLLNEYEILGEILEEFLVEETEKLGLQPPAGECFAVQRRLTASVRVLMRTTIDTFISEYTTTIEEQNERIKAFNRAASHELRSSIGTLMFAGALLQTDNVQQDRQRFAKVSQTVRASAERLSWIVENLQRMARVSEPVDVPSQQRVELSALAAEVARQLAEMAASRRVAIRISPDLPTLHTDPARVELVLLNLMSNAIKYSDSSKADAFVEIAPHDAAGEANDADGASDRSCVIAIRDNGIGIAEGDQSVVFDRFFRAHPHLDQELGVSGSGLGLAIVADCVTALGGSIRCTSTLGEGTTFFLTLPVDGTPLTIDGRA
jgi:signal transduction histidine kinase